MLDRLRQVMGLMGNLPQLREEMNRLQQRLGQISAEGDAGAGLVKVRVNGRMEVVACTLSDEALRLDDREMLEDLIRAAANQALERVRQQIAEETTKMASALGFPAGMGLPGMPGMPGERGL
jgi:DNA-binding YbaB/EbfC family protein